METKDVADTLTAILDQCQAKITVSFVINDILTL